ncbi:hypothetical protein ACFQ7B_14725 [Streptomyces erythrochromogenes]|uniref:hypothetical protein n=1 Tax=Streptomyces erythrochromogenes TaxID=285574 RepID=UPI0036C7A045
MPTYAWQSIADEFPDHLAALSVTTPDLDAAEAEAVLKDAATPTATSTSSWSTRTSA